MENTKTNSVSIRRVIITLLELNAIKTDLKQLSLGRFTFY